MTPDTNQPERATLWSVSFRISTRDDREMNIALEAFRTASGLPRESPEWVLVIEPTLRSRHPTTFRLSSDQFARFFVERRKAGAMRSLRWSDAVEVTP